MKRINNTFKAMTSQPTINNPAVPSMGGQPIKVNFKPVPNLSNFIRGHATVDLESRKTDKFKLKRKHYPESYTHNYVTYVILTYKVGRTKYILHSCTKFTGDKKATTTNEGYVKISKGLFKSREFKLVELPANIVTSINDQITLFNTAYEVSLVVAEDKLRKKKQKKEKNFFNGLDT